MRLRATLPAMFLGLVVALAIPASAEASHRHSRSCGHYYRPSHGYTYYRPAPRPYGVGAYYGTPPWPAYGYGYGYGYRPYYATPYRPYPPPYYRPYFAPPRPRVHISFGFGW